MGCKGARPAPLRDGSRESGSLHGRDATPNTLPSAARARCPHAADRIPCRIDRHQDGLIGLGMPCRGSAGNRRVPPARCAWYYHTLCSSLPGISPHYDYAIKRGRIGNVHRHYSCAICSVHCIFELTEDEESTRKPVRDRCQCDRHSSPAPSWILECAFQNEGPAGKDGPHD